MIFAGKKKLKQEKVAEILNLIDKLLQNPDVLINEELTVLLKEIQRQAQNGESYYDYQRKLQPTISRFAIENGFLLPKELLQLITLIKSPSAWSGM
ncbi:MAG: bacteriocin immunity protein [Enterococcus sp.]